MVSKFWDVDCPDKSNECVVWGFKHFNWRKQWVLINVVSKININPTHKTNCTGNVTIALIKIIFIWRENSNVFEIINN